MNAKSKGIILISKIVYLMGIYLEDLPMICFFSCFNWKMWNKGEIKLLNE
jgi:hypothetical protein